MIALPASIVYAQTVAYTGCGGVASPPVSNAAFEQTLIELVNAERASHGNLPPLKRTDTLDQAARYYAIDMALDYYFEFDHGTYDRAANHSLIKMCEAPQRLVTYYSNYSAMGENIAGGQSTPQDVLQSWMASTGHRDNILSTYYREIGVGYSPGGLFGSSWVQDFGRRNDVYPLVINREASAVQTRSVNLYIYGQGSWSDMRLRNDDLAWGNWQPFRSDVNWMLENSPGIRTVWIELRQGAQTYTTSDTILYNAPPAPSMENIVFLPISIR
jgi:uncharacterized protein YkwD